MPPVTSSASEPVVSPKLDNACDEFIGQTLPAWLRRASAQHINLLRDLFNDHHASQAQLQGALARLTGLDAFAAPLFEQALREQLACSVDLRQARWREVKRSFSVKPGQLPDDEFFHEFQPALQRLLQNFSDSTFFYPQTGLVAQEGDGRVLCDKAAGIVRVCRKLDVGQRYQEHLAKVLDPALQQALAQDKRHSLALSSEIAALKGQISQLDLQMLRRVVNGQVPTHAESGTVQVLMLELLGSRVDGALVFELQGSWGGTPGLLSRQRVQGVIVYLPGSEAPLRRYDSWYALSSALGTAVKQSGYQQHLLRLIGLRDLPAFMGTLQKRMQDARTDMAPTGAIAGDDLFASLASQHLQRIKDDARLLAVPTADADNAASATRIKVFEDSGLVLLNVAGLFVPALGALLVGYLVGTTLAEVFEGVADWARDRRYEALEHMLGVAETLAVGAAQVGAGTLVARGFVRSSAVESMQPVVSPAQAQRLWLHDLSSLEVDALPAGAKRLENGLFGLEGRHWWQDQGAIYEVRRADGQSSWRLFDPRGRGGFSPLLQFNGERGWRLLYQRPLEWQGSARLLACLWPEAATLDEARITQILRVADVDEEQLRGLLVENRALPVSLRDTLERFSVDARIEAYLGQLSMPDMVPDPQLHAYCLNEVAASALPDSEARAQVLAKAPALRAKLMAHFAQGYLRSDDLLETVKRFFPGLPDPYALALLQQADDAQRLHLRQYARLPLALAEQARSLLQAARLNRAVEGLYLNSSDASETVELVFALLRTKAKWPETLNLEWRGSSTGGARVTRMYPDNDPSALRVLIRQAGRFALYDHQNVELELEIAEPAGLYDALLALLPDTYRQRLGWSGENSLQQLRSSLQAWSAVSHQQLTNLLGWPRARPWFNPGQRLADGRVGYLLSGRSARARNLSRMTIRDRVRCLYPGLDEQQVSEFLQRLHEAPGSAFQTLLDHEAAYHAVDRHLVRWVAAGEGAQRNVARRLVADELRRCWRFQGEQLTDGSGRYAGMRLSLIGIRVESLPALPVQADFNHVTDLVLVNLGLQDVPSAFLQRFPRVRWLNLSNNHLQRVPLGLNHLPSLRELRLQQNRIRLDASGVACISALHQLRVLGMSHNPLGAIRLDLHSLHRLRELSLRQANLQRLPAGLLGRTFLEYADLRGNQITELPQALLNAPMAFREQLHLAGNPLSEETWQRFQGQDQLPVPVPLARELWLQLQMGDDYARRGGQWDQLFEEAHSTDFFQVLAELTGTSDFRLAREDLDRRVWEMIDAAQENTQLRNELFELADSPRTCVDSVANCFSALEVRVYMARALRGRGPGERQGVLLSLARRLFRLEQVERLAQDDIAARRADGRDVDEIEVSLAYRSGLATELRLPGQPRTMQFARVAGVSALQLAEAARVVRQAQAGEALAINISERDFWLDALHQAHADLYSSTDQPFQDRLDTLTEQQASLSDGEYLAQVNGLSQERTTALKALDLRLTKEALAAEVTVKV
ncbi:NEL-type E3 ubiquitin ligase domain-containing protein [Pseudomonas tructae]|nr:NEL-type E3 ubiquitin ligase domain-containing protein [Pseudomonas tructae]